MGTGALSQEELSIALNALASQAMYQGNPIARSIYEQVSQRVRGLDLKLDGKFLYPVYQQLNRSIVDTRTEKSVLRCDREKTLFYQFDKLETAILQGQEIELYRKDDFYEGTRVGLKTLWHLQIVYYDIAWYLVYETYETGQLAISRMNRFKNHCNSLGKHRNLEVQLSQLKQAHQLLKNGWGLYLGQREEQQVELQGCLTFTTVKVGFFTEVVPFILEGDRRHQNPKIRCGPKESKGEYEYVDYMVSLPPRSLKEFMLWVYRHMHNARVLSPPELVARHREAANALMARYDFKS